MNPRDEKIRSDVHDCLTQGGVDVRNLSLEVQDGHLTIRGSVASRDQGQRVSDLLRARANSFDALDCEVIVRPMSEYGQEPDGRGRSPVTGTSPDSQHESQHQLDN